VEVLDECASLLDSSRTGIQDGERPRPGDLGLCVCRALLRRGIFCAVKLLSSSQSTESPSLTLRPLTGAQPVAMVCLAASVPFAPLS